MSTANPTRIVVADDHECFRKGLSQMLEASGTVNIVAESSNGTELIKAAIIHAPDVILTDIRMPQMDGIQACKEISKLIPTCEVIALSNFDEAVMIYEMMEAGARGYVLKNACINEIIDAIKTVRAGSIFYCSKTNARLKNSTQFSVKKQQKNPLKQLSENEKKIIRYVCLQLTTKEIAEKMNLSIKSIENYSKSIKEKTESKNLVGIALFALKYGLIEQSELDQLN